MALSIKNEGPNRDEIEFWNGPQGQNWVSQNDLSDLMYDPFGAKVLERAALQPGERVIEVGCGCGKTTGKLAELVGPEGHVKALDISVPMLNVAKGRTSANAKQVEFIAADAEVFQFELGSFDAVFSQFGLMSFHNLDAAFLNLFRALKPNGRLTFVSWRLPDLNPWLVLPFEAVREFVPDIPRPSPHVVSSPFTLALIERVEDLLGDAGFVDVQLEVFHCPTRMGQGALDDCMEFVADFSNPVATALRRSDPELAPAILKSVRSALAPYHSGDTLALPGSAWIVSARRP
jgi:SAM-dependent methyltransferase